VFKLLIVQGIICLYMCFVLLWGDLVMMLSTPQELNTLLRFNVYYTMFRALSNFACQRVNHGNIIYFVVFWWGRREGLWGGEGNLACCSFPLTIHNSHPLDVQVVLDVWNAGHFTLNIGRSWAKAKVKKTVDICVQSATQRNWTQHLCNLESHTLWFTNF